jgi:predicted DNA-binding transcriptional regulator YafY
MDHPLRATIEQAIRQREIVSFHYQHHQRIVKPHALGIDHRGHLALRAYQYGGSSGSGSLPGWRFFHLTDMKNLHTTGSYFVGHSPGYRPNDTGMTIVLAELPQ